MLDTVESRSRVAVLPGSFDPPTLGHVDILLRGAQLFDRVIVAILRNSEKVPLFAIDERVAMIREAIADHPQIEVETFDGLLVDFAAARGAGVILRGIRALTDFEYEYQMALMNRKLNASIETIVMMPSEAYSYVSSRLVKEVASLGGDLSAVVPPSVAARLRKRFGGGR